MKPEWQNQSFAKAGNAGAPTPAGAPNKCYPSGTVGQLHSKIAVPTHGMGGLVLAEQARRGYADGGAVESDGEWARGENYGDGTTGDERVAMARSESAPAPAVETATEAKVEQKVEEKAEAPKKESFKEAFARNRASGAKTFEWNGKKFTTELAESKAAKPSTPAKAEAPKSSGMSLAQSKGNEYAQLERIAKAAESNPGVSAAAKAAARKNADAARATYEAASDAEKTGRSVVFKR